MQEPYQPNLTKHEKQLMQQAHERHQASITSTQVHLLWHRNPHTAQYCMLTCHQCGWAAEHWLVLQLLYSSRHAELFCYSNSSVGNSVPENDYLQLPQHELSFSASRYLATQQHPGGVG